MSLIQLFIDEDSMDRQFIRASVYMLQGQTSTLQKTLYPI
jgi:hypothetical protein